MRRRQLTEDQKRRGLVGRVWVYLFGSPRKRTAAEKRKGKLRSKRVLGIMLLVAIGVLQVIADSPVIQDPKTVGVLTLVGTILTTIGILAHKVKTYGLDEVFGELKE